MFCILHFAHFANCIICIFCAWIAQRAAFSKVKHFLVLSTNYYPFISGPSWCCTRLARCN